MDIKLEDCDRHKVQLLPFISNFDLYQAVEKVLYVSNFSVNIHRNVIDPFSALFDALRQDISVEQWLTQETMRQSQKTLQNAIGDFHQKILGSVVGWDDLGTGHIFDLKNDSEKIIAEIKNKHNTTKGNHKVAIYDDLKKTIKC
jgi:hypothetical protein